VDDLGLEVRSEVVVEATASHPSDAVRSSTPIPTSSAVRSSAAIRSKVVSAVEATNCVAPAALTRWMAVRSRMLQATLAWIGTSGKRARTTDMASKGFIRKPSTPHVA
jgi:hypothetical protein